MCKSYSILLLFLYCHFAFSQHPVITLLNQERPSSYRGLSVVSDKTIWISGSNGTVGLSTDGGQNWQWVTPIGYEKLDFRDIEGFDENTALTISAGSPAVILKTTDGGRTWGKTYSDDDPDIFYNGFAFCENGVGIAFGDAIGGKLPLLKTTDFGDSWHDISRQFPFVIPGGEAGFAASGTSIFSTEKGHFWIATGGRVSNIYHSADYGGTWAKYPCPIMQGKDSTGPFSIAFVDEQNGIVVGGNYKNDSLNENVVLLTNDMGKTWISPITPTSGFKSCVIYLSKKSLVATGTSGTDISHDGGATWINLSKESYNAIQKAKNGSKTYLVGNEGKIALLSADL